MRDKWPPAWLPEPELEGFSVENDIRDITYDGFTVEPWDTGYSRVSVEFFDGVSGGTEFLDRPAAYAMLPLLVHHYVSQSEASEA